MSEATNGGDLADSQVRRGWRGRIGARAKAVRHRWQKDWTAQPLEHLQTQEHWRRIRTFGLIATAVLLLAGLVARLIFLPQLTPWIAVATVDSSWPIAPHVWAREDLAQLQHKDFGLDGQNLSITDLSKDWRSREAGLRSLEQTLAQSIPQARRQGLLVLYFSMPGAVDGNGDACLIPPGVTTFDPGNWLPLTEITTRLRAQNLPRDCRVLLILDSARADVDWKIGTLENTFVAGLEALIRKSEMPNLVILNSAGRGQRSWTAPELRGSVFGHFLRLGLAGEADVVSGNRDRRVTMRELIDYLDKEVNEWTRFHRGADQVPALVPSTATDFQVAWALRPSARRLVKRELPPAVAPAVTDAELAQLWTARERLQAAQMVSLDAAKWHRIEHDLLRLEAQLRGGSAFQESSRTLAKSLKSLLARYERQVGAASRWRLQPGESLWPVETHLHSLAELRRVAMSDAPEVTRQYDVLRNFAAAPSSSRLAEAVASLRPLPTPVATETQFLALLGAANADAWWDRPGVVGELVRQQMLAEELAAPRDPRPGVWFAPATEAGDQSRRAAIDQMMIGDAAHIAEADAANHQAAAHYEAAQAWSTLATGAYELLDNTHAELPYLAEWLCQPRPTIAEAMQFDREINETLLPLIEDVQELQALLAVGDGVTAQPPTDSAVLNTRLVELRGRRDKLNNLLLDQARALVADKTLDGRNIRAIDALLATPLLPTTLRDELWKARGKLSVELERRYTQEDRPDAPTIDASQYHERITSRWTRHPLAALWNLETTDNADGGKRAVVDPVQLGNLARLHLWRLPERSRSALASGGDAPATSAEPSLTPAEAEMPSLGRERWSRWEQSLRAALPYMIDRDDTPLTLVRRLDLQQLQLWQARRALDDFFGPAATGESPFFATAATDYLNNARKLATPGAIAQQEIEQLTELRDARLSAAQLALSANAADLLVVDPSENLDLTIDVRRNDTAAAGLPEGTPAVWVRDQQGRLPVGAAAEFGAEPVKFSLPAVDLAARGPALDAVVTLRGNERSTAFLLRPPAGVSVDVTTHRFGPPRVVVQGRRRQAASVVFILDASYSMRDPIPGVESAGQTAEIPRIDAAKDALRRMMTQLAMAGDARVGVRIFGHRVGWTTSEPTQILPQPNYTRPYPPDLTPAEDVELILPLGRFDESVAGELDEILTQVQPWGQSPLYLAIRQALDDFTGENPDAERRIVVITDGTNYQFNALQPTTRDDVLAIAAGRNIPINIVGFGVPAGEAAQASSEFQAIANQTGGTYVTVENATSLIASLEEMLGPTQYRITGPDGELFGPARVGTQLAITPKPSSPSEFSVFAAAAEKTLTLSGGEAVELQLDRGGRDLLVVPFELNDSVSAPIVAGNSAVGTDLNFVAHRALRTSDGVRFTFSLQGAERQFVPRPAEIWIELTPLATDGRRLPSAYYLYDANFVPETSCPVVSWQALGWPDGSREAQAKIWMRPNATSADLVITNLGEAVNQQGTTHRVPGLDGVSAQLRVRMPRSSDEPTRLSLVERHEPNSPGLGALKVELVPPPVSVSHRWDRENGLVVHLFELSADASTIDDYQLQLTRFDHLAAEAWTSREPVTVEIGASDNLLRLDASNTSP
jgi:hypothetical protein